MEKVSGMSYEELVDKEYLENKKGLDQYEVALLAYDIETINHSIETSKEKKEKLENEILVLNNETNTSSVESLEDEKKLDYLQKELLEWNQKLLRLTEEKEKILGEKNLLIEKNKSSKEEEEVKAELRRKLEEKETVEANIKVLETELKELTENLSKKDQLKKDSEREMQNHKLKKNILMNDFSTHSTERITLQHKIDALNNEIEQNSDMPNSVRKVLNNTSLTGIYNTIGNVIGTEEKYVKALNTAVASNKNFVITKDEESAKKAIAYLKDNHLGRATFFPLSVIKEREVDLETLNIVKNSNDYLGVMSDLITYNKEFDKVIKNQLGIVLVVTDIDAATRISHMIKAKYRIVTLEGDVVNVGGSLTGGSAYHGKSTIILKQECKHLEEKVELLKQEEKEIQQEILDLNKESDSLEEKILEQSKEKAALEQILFSKQEALKKEKEQKEIILKEQESLEAIENNSLDQKEQEYILTKQFYLKQK